MFIHTCTKCFVLNTRLIDVIHTHITEVFSVLLGQDNSWEVHHTGELDSAGRLAVEPFIENVLGVSNFEDVHRVLR